MNSSKNLQSLWPRVIALIGLMGCGVAQVHATPIYSQDPSLSHFTSTVTEYATFAGGYQPSTAILLGTHYPRVVGVNGNPVDVTFSTATSNIVVFDNIDHLGYSWDVFQYKIAGSNDGVNYAQLFDPQAVNEPNQANVNASFTLKTYTGTAPTLLNNTLTPGLGGTGGNIGYEEYFTFGSNYKYFRFTPSSLTLTDPTGENELELSAVGAALPSQQIIATAVPEPGSTLLVGIGLAALLACTRRRKSTV